MTVATTDGVHSTETALGGGFGMILDAPGDYTLKASGGKLRTPITIPFTLLAENVKVDFVAPVVELIRSSFKVNFKKQPKDLLMVKALVDTSRFPADPQGLEVEIHLADLTFGPYALTAKAKGKMGIFKTEKGMEPKILVKLAMKSGKLLLKVAKDDLIDGLGIENATVVDDIDRELRIVVGDDFDELLDVKFALRSKEGKKASARSR